MLKPRKNTYADINKQPKPSQHPSKSTIIPKPFNKLKSAIQAQFKPPTKPTIISKHKHISRGKMHLTSIIKDNIKAIEEITNPKRKKSISWSNNKESPKINNSIKKLNISSK